MLTPFAPSQHALGMHFPDHYAHGGGRRPWMPPSPFGYPHAFAPSPRCRDWHLDPRLARPMEGEIPFELPYDGHHYSHRPPPCFACGARPFVDGPPPPPMGPHGSAGPQGSPRCCRRPPRPDFDEDNHEPMGHRHSRRHPPHHGRRHDGIRVPPPPPSCPHHGPPSPPSPPQHNPPPSHSHRDPPPPPPPHAGPPPTGPHRGGPPPPPPGPPSAGPPHRHAPDSHGPLPPHPPSNPPCNEASPDERRPFHGRGRTHRSTRDGQRHHHHHDSQQQQHGHSRRDHGGHGRGYRRHSRGQRGHHQHRHNRPPPPHERDHYAHCEWCPPRAPPTSFRRPNCDCSAFEALTISDDSGVDSDTDESTASEDGQEQFEVVQPREEGHHCEEEEAEEVAESDKGSTRGRGEELKV